MKIARVIALGLVAGAMAACAGKGGGGGATMTARSIDEVLAVGTAVGLCGGERCIKVLLADSSTKSKIPARLEGYRVVVDVTGTITPR